MRRLSGQAARHLARSLHRLARLAMIAAVLVVVAVAGLSWRLAQGPLELPALTRYAERAMQRESGGLSIAIGHAALAWEGFRLGADMPLDIRLRDVVIGDPAHAQHLVVPRASVSLSIAALLFGHIRPRAVELDGLALDLLRLPDGTVRIGAARKPGSPENAAAPMLAGLLAELARPPTDDRSRARPGGPPPLLAQMRRLSIAHAHLLLVDQRLGAIFTAPEADLTLRRLPGGGLDGSGTLMLALGGARSLLTLQAHLPPGGDGPIRLTAQLGAVSPARLAQGARGLAALGAIDAPVTARARLTLDPALRVTGFGLDARAGAGSLRLGGATLDLADARIQAEGTPEHAHVTRLVLRLADGGRHQPVTLRLSGDLARTAPGWRAALHLGIARLNFAALPALWPPDIARNARVWITANIPQGIAEQGSADLTLTSGKGFADPSLIAASGEVAAHGLEVHWLRPVPPLIQGSAVLHWLNPDALRIDIAGGTQRDAAGGASSLQVGTASVGITGLTQHDQIATIDGAISGKIADALTLLAHPRLRLLSLHPFPLHDPAGQFAGRISLRVPLDNDVQMADIAISAHADLHALHLSRLVAGRDLDQGEARLDANADGLKIAGTARIAGLATRLAAQMDFRAGPPSQALEQIEASTTASPEALKAAGLDTDGLLQGGQVTLHAALIERRDASGRLTLDAGLTDTTLRLAPLAWEKNAAIPARAAATIDLLHDRLADVPRLSLTGTGVDIAGQAQCSDGRIRRIELARFTLGMTRAQGSVTLPAAAGAPLGIRLSGPMIDLSARLAHRPAPAKVATKKPETAGPALAVDAHFAQALMAHDMVARDLALRLRDDGTHTQALSLTGHLPQGTPFSLTIARQNGVRRIAASTADAGGLLRALDVLGSMQGGTLTLAGQYDDTTQAAPLSGTATIEDFRIKGAPALGRLLQAMTLYGLVDVVSGPGLAFHRLTAPFTLADDVLTLHDARAFSASLGLTAKGTLDLANRQAALSGTIVPAYFFNTLLGHIPLLGRLFSPEQGGGVFAASYQVDGPLDDPKVSVNPLAALTPGALRGLFGLF
ncbi:MAG: hypothetical protein KGL12_00940 [Rhodospirillales bacterium]|nr:hypothetical protein [Rhodospirillales bacterium]